MSKKIKVWPKYESMKNRYTWKTKNYKKIIEEKLPCFLLCIKKCGTWLCIKTTLYTRIFVCCQLLYSIVYYISKYNDKIFYYYYYDHARAFCSVVSTFATNFRFSLIFNVRIFVEMCLYAQFFVSYYYY